VHILPELRGQPVEANLPELWRQLGATPDSAVQKLTQYPASTVRIFKPEACGQIADSK
jgi:hypothetical protein